MAKKAITKAKRKQKLSAGEEETRRRELIARGLLRREKSIAAFTRAYRRARAKNDEELVAFVDWANRRLESHETPGEVRP